MASPNIKFKIILPRFWRYIYIVCKAINLYDCCSLILDKHAKVVRDGN